MSRIGFIGASSATTSAQNLEAFRQGLRDLHYVEGENMAIGGSLGPKGLPNASPSSSPSVIGLKVDVLLVSAAAGALAAKNSGITTPVVFAAVTDPIGYGIIHSLAQPGGNMTGVALAVGKGFSGKWVELLKETVAQGLEDGRAAKPKPPRG